MVSTFASMVPVAQTEAGFPYKRVGAKSRIEGPVVPAPKNWGYRPTRWVRWETDIIHPALGPVAPDAKKEVKMPDGGQPDETETNGTSDTPNSKTTENVPPSSSGSEMLPPLPTDDGPPASPPNLDEDLPPLPGEDFNPPGTTSNNPAPSFEPPKPESIGPSKTPSIRDPDAIFDKSDEQKQPDTRDAETNILPPLPGGDSPVKETPSTPQPRQPEPAESQPALPDPPSVAPPSAPQAPQAPQNNPSVPTETPLPPRAEPAESEPSQWEKRTREKPVTPKDIQKGAPEKKPGEPFYDPDSIFDERAARKIEPATIEWQKAGTAEQRSAAKENGTDLSNTLPSQSQSRVFIPRKRVKHRSISQMVSQASPSAAAAVNVPAIFDAERSQALRRPQATWKATKQPVQPVQPMHNEQLESATVTPQLPRAPQARQAPQAIRQDHHVRPISYEEPVLPAEISHTTTGADVAINPHQVESGTVMPTIQVQNGRLSAIAPTAPRSVPLTVNTPNRPQAVKMIGVDPRVTQPVTQQTQQRHQETATSRTIETKNIPTTQFKSLRNPMRSLEVQHDAVSEDNPLRERKSSVRADRASGQSNLSNPLR
ncbi:MAG: hypothetical protein VX970_08795 [Planctomycetota bacterium]|nr:hypothetical protein [Planctomycetota bacterium]